MRFAVICGLVLSALAAQASAAPDANSSAAVTQSSDPAAKAAALKLAAVLFSEASQVAVAEKLVDSEIGPAFRSNEDFKTLEAEYPGFTDAVIMEMKPALVRFTRQALPGYHDRVANLIASRLEAAEITDLTQFYLTPTGQKLLKGMQQNVTTGTMLAEAMNDPDKPTSYSAVAADHKAASAATTKLIDDSDRAQLIEFVKKPYFAKVAALGPAMRKLEQDFTNEPAPELEAEIEAIMKATVARFEAEREK